MDLYRPTRAAKRAARALFLLRKNGRIPIRIRAHPLRNPADSIENPTDSIVNPLESYRESRSEGRVVGERAVHLPAKLCRLVDVVPFRMCARESARMCAHESAGENPAAPQ